VQKVIIGIISRPRGIKGEIKVIPLTDKFERFKQLKNVTIVEAERELGTFEIKKVAITAKTVNLKLKGIDTRDQALELKGKEIIINEDQIFPLDDGNYYIFQIIGLEAFDKNGEYLGKVSDVLKNPGNDVFLIERENKEYLVPAVKEIVNKIDLKSKKIIINRIEGLFD